MTDDLINRLREVAIEKQSEAWWRVDGGQDCSISAMLAEEWADRIQAQAAEIERLRGDLAKAVEALEDIRRYSSCGYAGRKSLDTLAELTGAKT